MTIQIKKIEMADAYWIADVADNGIVINSLPIETKFLDWIRQQAKQDVFDDIDKHIGLWVAQDKDSKPNHIQPQWYKELKEMHLHPTTTKASDKP